MKLLQIVLMAIISLALTQTTFARSSKKSKTKKSYFTSKKKAKKRKKSKFNEASLFLKKGKLKKRRKARMFYKITPQIGMTSFSLTNDSTADIEYDQGFAAGFRFEFGKKRWAGEVGLLYLQLQSRGRSRTANQSFDVEFTTNYIALPVVAKYRVLQNRKYALYIKGGLMPATLQSSEVRSGSFSSSNNGDYNSFDLMGVAGAGMNFKTSRSTSMFIDGTYNRGFNDVSSDSSSEFSESIYNQGFILSTGLAIQI